MSEPAPHVNGDTIRYTTKELLAEIRSELVGVRQDVRDRYHKLAGTVEGMALRLAIVEEQHKDLAEDVRHATGQAREIIELKRRVEVSEQVQAALKKQAGQGLSFADKLVALVLAGGTFVLLLIDRIPN